VLGKLASVLLALLLVAASGWLAFQLLAGGLPSVDDLGARVHGNLANRNAPYSHLDVIPVTVQQATIVTEDTRFQTNGGVDPRGVIRAVVDDVLRACLCEGGSTITQQLAKQVYLGGDDATVRRKIDTIVLAVEIDHHYSKNDVLEFYLNTAYYGHGTYGVAAAARTYWRRPIGQVDLAQAAMLAGLPQAPSDYDPIVHPDAARARRNTVLNRLLNLGLITSDQLRLASAQPAATLPLNEPGTPRARAASYDQ
jgi:membrane peptidoglycan carboxypeptidase